MTKYLLLKHYRGAPEAVNDVPMDQWTPAGDRGPHAVHERLRRAGSRAPASSSTARRSRPRARSSGTTGRADRRSPTGRSRRPRT